MLLLLRVAAVVVGAVALFQLTAALFEGQITYSIQDISAERVTTKTLPEAFSIWLAFGTLCVGLILVGVAPHWYIDKPWLWKVLASVIGVGYVLSSLLH